MRWPSSGIALVALAWLVLAVPGGAWAEDHSDNDHDLARDLYEHGQIKSLSEILTVVRNAVAGDVVAVDLLRAGGHWTYRVQIVDGNGKRTTVDVNATTATMEPAPQGNP